jgi:predicted Zn-dependent protease
MKKFFKIFIPLVIIGILAYQFRFTLTRELLPIFENLKNQIQIKFFPEAPCSEPIPYTLGTFATKFNISESYFLSALVDAEAIWEKPFSQEFFVYRPEDSASASPKGLYSRDVLKINLIYDYRQQATDRLKSLGIVVKDDRASYDMLKAKFTALKAQYDREKAAYDARVSAFNKSSRNDRAEFESLQNEQKNLNNMVDEINTLVVALNRLVVTLNLSVNQYNTVSGARGESFEEGVYISDGSNRQIDIYEFSDRAKLVRVLAHELGHALGLDHVDDPKAMMYELNQSNSLTLNQTDLDALAVMCGEK